VGAVILILSRDRTYSLVAVILDMAFWAASLCLTYEMTSYTVYLILGSGSCATTYIFADCIQTGVPTSLSY
jgi:hypothetical protein